LNVARSNEFSFRSTTVPNAPASAIKTVPTGFSGVPPPGPAMPVTAIAKSDAEFFPRALGHFARDGFAHRAVLAQSFRANAEKFFLHVIRVTHHAAEKNRRRARHIRHAVRDKSARAGFRQRESFFLFRQKPHDNLLDFLVVKTVNVRGKNFCTIASAARTIFSASAQRAVSRTSTCPTRAQ
jgi:hypothetical protein